MNAIELIAEDLFEKVRSRYSKLQMGDENGSVTATPKDARFFDFDFTHEGENLGRVSISINDTGNLKIFYGQGITENTDSDIKDVWYDFLREMRFFAKRRLLRFDTRDINKGNLDKTDFNYLAQNKSKDRNMNKSVAEGMPSSVIKSKQEFSYMTPEELYKRFKKQADAVNKPIEQVAREAAWRHGYGKMSSKYWDRFKNLIAADAPDGISESAMYGSSKTSHRTIENTDLIIRHSEAIDPTQPGARSRKIKNLFIQNKEGERFKFPFNYLPGARAMQRHVANNGYPHDDAGKKIIETCEEILKLSDFGRKVRRATLNDDAHAIAEKAGAKLTKLRQHMDAMSKQRYYECWMETVKPDTGQLIELDAVTMESLKSAFTVSKFDESLAEMFPLLHAIMQETSELDLGDYVGESVVSEKIGDIYSRRQCEIVDDLGDGYFLGDDSYDDDDGFVKEGWSVYFQEGQDQFRYVGPVNVSPYSGNRKPGEIENKIKQMIDADKEANSHRAIDELAFESWVDSVISEGLTDDQIAQLEPLVQEPMPVGANGEAEQTLAGIGIKDQTLTNALRATAALPDGANADAREILKSFLGADSAKINWGDGEAAPQPMPEVPAQSASQPAEEDSIETDDKHKLIEPENKQSKMKDVAKIVMGFYDREQGTWTRGEHGVVTHVKRQFSNEDGKGGEKEAALAAKLIQHLNHKYDEQHAFEEIRRLAGLQVVEAKKPSAGLSKDKKSATVKKAKAGGDIGKKGKGFDALAKSAGGGEKGKKIAAAAMWKNIKR